LPALGYSLVMMTMMMMMMIFLTVAFVVLLQPTLVPNVNRSAEFNARFNPLHLSCLRRIFLTSDNSVGGRYYAGILQVLIHQFVVFNCLHGQAPPYLVELCQRVAGFASRQHLRSATRQLLVVPRHQLSSYGRRAFCVAGPSVWNSLPDSLWNPIIGRNSFRQFLKTFFVHNVLMHSAH